MKRREKSMRKESFRLYMKKNWQLYLLMVLPLLFILIFKYAAYSGLVIAFKDYKVAKGFADSKWVGFRVFEKIFAHRDFGKAVKNTLLLNILDLIFSFPMPIILALILNEIKCKWFKRVSQTLLYLPHFLSWVIIGALGYQLFSVSSGVVNVLIQNMGSSPIPFLQDDTWWLVSYILIGVWQSMGWGVCHGKWEYEIDHNARKHLFPEGATVKGREWIYLTDGTAQVLAEEDGRIAATLHEFGKGKGIYLGGFELTNANTRMLLNLLLYGAGLSTTQYYLTDCADAECAYYPQCGQLVVMNHCEHQIITSVLTEQGKKEYVLDAFEMQIKDI